MVPELNNFLCPEKKDVEMRKTKENVGTFLSQYLSYRQSVGQPREPKITASFSLTPISSSEVTKQAEDILIYNEEIKEKFLKLHEQFVFGYSAIQHPFKPEITKRRQKIFYVVLFLDTRFMFQLSGNHISDDLVEQESSLSLIMFANALGILVVK